MTKQGPKPPIHREHVMGGSTTDPHETKPKLDSTGGNGGARGWPSTVGAATLSAAVKAIPKN